MKNIMSSSQAKVQQTKLLPNWNLNDLYHKDSLEEDINNDLAKLKNLAQDFADKYKNKVVFLKANQLLKALAEYEEISELAGKLSTYAYLSYSVALNDTATIALYQKIQESITSATANLIFFTLEINTIPDEEFAHILQGSDELYSYKNWFVGLRAMKPFQLSEAEEKLLHEKAITGNHAWVRLYDETLESLRFNIDNKTIPANQALEILSDADPVKRKDAAQEISRIFNENKRIFTFIINTIIKDKYIDDQKRGLQQPIKARNIVNQIEDEVVETLIEVVKQNYANLSHRYYKLKSKLLGKQQLAYWDRNAPLPMDDNRLYSWQEAKNIVLDSYHEFSPEMAQLAQKFFDNNWIDAPPTAGKMSGAYSHPSVPSVHPYILVNFHGKARDIMTLAHELGHGVHQILAAQNGYLLADTPLTIAETASVFGEQLVFRNLLKLTKDRDAYKVMLAQKIEDMLNTVIRQIAFCEFEKQLHSARREGELSADQIGSIWMKIQQESLGNAFDLEEGYSCYWMYISHFIHAPFYVYAYAFGDCLVNSLYGLYAQNFPNFKEKYLELLKAGGSRNYKELLAEFGLDAKSPEFWQHGLNTIANLIDELEGLLMA
jgi:oligoendopeptidase F